MKEAGFDTIPLQRFPWDRGRAEGGGRAAGKTRPVRGGSATAGLRIFMQPAALPLSGKLTRSSERVVEDYKEYGNIREWIICDEPGARNLPFWPEFVDAFRRIDPDRKTFINLLPLYAPEEMLGTASYEEYVERFCEMVKPHYLCYDYYDFLGSGETQSRRGTYLQNMEIIKSAAEKYGLETRVIVLLTEHGPYSNVTPTEIAWQANLSLLYGMKSHFLFHVLGAGRSEFYVVERHGGYRRQSDAALLRCAERKQNDARSRKCALRNEFRKGF